MPPPFEIREPVPEDAPALVALLAQLGYAGADSFISRRLMQQRSHPDALMLVASTGDRLLGFISLHFIPQVALAGDFCRISYFCVDEKARAMGVGAQLEERAEAAARDQGCDRIEVHCHERRVDAHRFYHRQGYEESPKYLMKLLG
jgi:GNAT superfamily N-acetyltransferase